MNVEHEVKLLVQEIKRLGSPNADGQVSVKFGVLFNDDRCANIFEGENLNHFLHLSQGVLVVCCMQWQIT